MFKINLINSSSFSSTCCTESAEYREGKEGKFIRGKRQEGRSKVYLTPIFHNAKKIMYTPSKLYAMPLLSSSTVTALGNDFCVHNLFLFLFQSSSPSSSPLHTKQTFFFLGSYCLIPTLQRV